MALESRATDAAQSDSCSLKRIVRLKIMFTLTKEFAVVFDVGGDFRFVGEQLLRLLAHHLAQLCLTE